jgi:2-dehydrotetronate isomerase
VLLAANTGFLWKELPFLERLKHARDAGFTALEFHDEAQTVDADALVEAMREAGLPVLGLNTRMGPTMGVAAMPGEAAQARADIDDAVRVARLTGASAIHVTAGKAEGDAARMAYMTSLIHALDAFDGTVLIEPISLTAVPGYFLNSLYQAADIADTLDNPRLKLMFDVYHVRAMGYDLVRMAGEFMPFIGHVQLSGWPGRDEPVLAGSMIGMLRALGYQGHFSAEYTPRSTVEDGLGWMAGVASRSMHNPG